MTLLLLLTLPGLLIIGLLYQLLGSCIDERRFPSPGRIIDIGGCKLHLNRQGAGRPMVVLEAGIAATSISCRRCRRVLPRTALPAVMIARGVMQNLAKEVAKLPRELHSVVRAHWSRPKAFLAMAEYLEALPACATAALTMTVPSNIPVTILSAGNAIADELRERDAWAARSECGRHIKVSGTGHWLQLEKPELVAATVQEMIEQLRHCTQANDPGLSCGF